MASKKTKEGNVKRRDMLKVLGAAPAAALVHIAPAAAQQNMASMPMPQGSSAENAGTVAGPYKPKVLNPHEWRTINLLSDIIIPADQQSGSATQAGVPAFIDDWLDFRGGDLLAEIRGGLTWLDMETNRQYGRDFVDCSVVQQHQILDRIAYPKRAAPADHNAVVFFNHLRDLVTGGFFSSKMGVEDLHYMGNQMLSAWNGCPSDALAKLGVSYGGAGQNAAASGAAAKAEPQK